MVFRIVYISVYGDCKCRLIYVPVLVIENMSCQGHTLGGRFEEIRDIISQVKDKSRVGVCIDTCHAFAAGQSLCT